MKIDGLTVRKMNKGNLKGFAVVTLKDNEGDALVIDGIKIMEKRDGTALFI